MTSGSGNSYASSTTLTSAMRAAGTGVCTKNADRNWVPNRPAMTISLAA